MRRFIATFSAAALGLVGVLAGTAQADTDYEGAFSQETRGLLCEGILEGNDTEQGHMSVRLRGGELRKEGVEFLMAWARTAIHAQKRIAGDWVTLNKGFYWAFLGQARDRGDYNFAPFKYPGMAPKPTFPRLGVDVPNEGTWRVVAVTNVYNTDGVQLRQLRTTQGVCEID